MEPEDEVSKILDALQKKSLSAKLAAVFTTTNTDDKRAAFDAFEDAGDLFTENNELLSANPENESSFPHSIASLKQILVEPLANCLLPTDREEFLAIFKAIEERDNFDEYLHFAKEFQENMKTAVEGNRAAYNAQANPQTPAQTQPVRPTGQRNQPTTATRYPTGIPVTDPLAEPLEQSVDILTAAFLDKALKNVLNAQINSNLLATEPFGKMKTHRLFDNDGVLTVNFTIIPGPAHTEVETFVKKLASCCLPTDGQKILALYKNAIDNGQAPKTFAKILQKYMQAAVARNTSAYQQVNAPSQQATPPTPGQQPNQAGAPVGAGYSPLLPPRPQPPQPSNPAGQYIPVGSAEQARRNQEKARQSQEQQAKQQGPGPLPRPPGQPAPLNQYQAFPHLPQNLQKDALLAGLQWVIALGQSTTKQAVLNLLNPPSTGNFLSHSDLTSASFDQLKSFVVQAANCFSEPQKGEILRTFNEKENNPTEYRSLAIGLRTNLNLALTLYKEINPSPEEPVVQQSQYISLPGWSTESLFEGLKAVDENKNDENSPNHSASLTASLHRDSLHIFETDNKAQNILLLELNQGNAQEFVRNCASCFISPQRETIETALNAVQANPQACLKLAEDLQENLLVTVAAYTNTPLAESAEAEQSLPPEPGPVPREPAQQAQSTSFLPPALNGNLFAKSMLKLDRTHDSWIGDSNAHEPWMSNYAGLRNNQARFSGNIEDVYSYVDFIVSSFDSQTAANITQAYTETPDEHKVQFALELQAQIRIANNLVAQVYQADRDRINNPDLTTRLTGLRNELTDLSLNPLANPIPASPASPQPTPPAPSAALRFPSAPTAAASATAHTSTKVSDADWIKIKQAVKQEAVKFGKRVAEPTPDKISIIPPPSTGIVDQGVIDITKHASGLDVSTTESPPQQKTLQALVANYKIAASVLGIKECEISSAENASATARLIIALDKGPNSIKPIVSETLLQDLKRAAAITSDPRSIDYTEAVKIYEKWNPAPRSSPSPS